VAVGQSQESDQDADLWWRYFAHASPAGATWSDGPFVPIFQTEGVMRADVLVRDRAEAYPHLAEITIGVTTIDGDPALRAHTEQPFATGFWIATGDATPVTIDIDEAWPLPREPAGIHEVSIATTTPYGTLASARVVMRIR
jgi:hypothetical protein